MKRPRSLSLTRKSVKKSKKTSPATALSNQVARVNIPSAVSVANLRIYKYVRRTQLSIAMNQSTGWGGLSSYSLNWSFALDNTQGYINGIFTYNIPVPNYAEFASLYDYWRIGGVEMKIFYSANHASNAVPTLALPLFLIDNDYDDVDNGETVTTMAERQGTRYLQMGNTRPVKHCVKPAPVGPLQTTTSGGSIGIVNSAGLTTSGTWLNSGAPGVRHNGIKIVWDSQGRTSNADVGTCTFVFDTMYEFKGYR